MFKYNVYVGHPNKFDGFTLLGEINHNYPLNKGDVICFKGEGALYEKLNDKSNSVSVDDLSNKQQFRIAIVHHWIGSEEKSVADLYFVTEELYEKKYL